MKFLEKEREYIVKLVDNDTSFGIFLALVAVDMLLIIYAIIKFLGIF